MIPEIEQMKIDLFEKYGTSGVEEMMCWCSAFLRGYRYAKENEKGQPDVIKVDN